MVILVNAALFILRTAFTCHKTHILNQSEIKQFRTDKIFSLKTVIDNSWVNRLTDYVELIKEEQRCDFIPRRWVRRKSPMETLNISRLTKPTYVAGTPVFSTVTLLLNKIDGNLRNHFFFSNQTSPEEHFEDNTFFLKKKKHKFVHFSDFERQKCGLSDQKFFVTNKFLPSLVKTFRTKFSLGC